MPDNSSENRLIRWSLGTFHTSFFILVLVIYLYARGVLGDLLGSLNTLIGFVLFGALWLLTVWSTGRALGGLATRQTVPFTILIYSPGVTNVLFLGMFWGGANGVLFFLVLLVFFVAFLILNAAMGSIESLLALPLYGLLGALVAAVAGGAAGFLLAILDSLILAFVKEILTRWSAQD